MVGYLPSWFLITPSSSLLGRAPPYSTSWPSGYTLWFHPWRIWNNSGWSISCHRRIQFSLSIIIISSEVTIKFDYTLAAKRPALALALAFISRPSSAWWIHFASSQYLLSICYKITCCFFQWFFFRSQYWVYLHNILLKHAFFKKNKGSNHCFLKVQRNH